MKVSDGVKIGVGLIVAKWLIGLAGCGALVGAVVCAAGLSGSSEPKAATTLRSPVPIVRWERKCRIRAKPTTKSNIVGSVVPEKAYPVLKRSGRWVYIAVGVAPVGWVGCPVGK